MSYSVTRLQSHSTIPSGAFTLTLEGGLVTQGISPFASVDTVRNAINAVSSIYNVSEFLCSMSV